MLSELRADFDRHGRSVKSLGFWLVALYRFGRYSYELPGPFGSASSKLYGALIRAEELFLGSVVERNTQIGEGLVLMHAHGIRIAPRAVLGQRVRIAHGVTIGTGMGRPGVPVIGDDVVIGAGSSILGPVKVGNGARIEPNTLVVGDVPEGAVVSGVPARVVRRTQNGSSISRGEEPARREEAS